jgi:hypothetical protein
MKTNDVSRLVSVLVALMVFAAACSGGSDEAAPTAEEIADDPVNAPIDQIDDGSGGVQSGAIAGLLTVQPSFGFGVFDVDQATGQAEAVPGIATVETVDRNSDLVVSGDAAYALGGKVRDEQSFASDISVVKIDYTTGQVSQLTALGFDRETDDSPEFIAYKIEAVAGDSVIVSSGAFGGDDAIFTVYDANSGEQTSSYPEPFYEFSSDAGTCSGDVANLVGLSDGRLIGTAIGSPAFVDIATGEVELLTACNEEDPELIEFVTPAMITDYAVFNEGSAPTDEQLERLLMTDLNPVSGFVEGDGDLWWVQADSRQIDDVQVILGGVVQFDLETASVEAVHPLGEHLGEYTDCGPDSDICELSTLGQAQLRYFDGRLILLDVRENGSLLTLDPATSAITVTEIELGDGVDFTRADLLAGDPNGIWIEVSRMTITKDDETGRSSSGPKYIEHFDTATSQIDMSLAAEDLFF